MPPQIRSYAAAPCPACQARMAIRRCPRAHRLKRICELCRLTLPLPIDITLRLAGWPMLPGFETREACMTTATTKIVIVAGQEFSVPAGTDNEAIRTQLAGMGFADVASATIQPGKRKVGDEEVQTVEFVKKAGTKGMDGAELAALVARVPAASLPKVVLGGPNPEQAALLRTLCAGALSIGEALDRTQEIDTAVYSLDRLNRIEQVGSALCDRISLHPVAADTGVLGW